MKWILIDLSFMAHRARHATSELEFEDMATGVLYGFFEQLYSTCTNPPVSSNKILIFTDSKKSYREKVFPDYKRKRKESRTPEEIKELKLMYKQIDKLKNKLFPKMGIPVYKQVGLESDDLIANASLLLNGKQRDTIIITSDGDLYQCITPFVKWFDPQRGLLMDEKAFKEKYWITPEQWGQVKSLAGCPSDNVPGLKGIGKKTALNYITGEQISPGRLATIENSQEEIKKWEELVILPHHMTKTIKLKTPKYKPEVFFKFCEEHGIESYLEEPRHSQWMKFFNGEFKGKARRRKSGKGKRKRKLF